MAYKMIVIGTSAGGIEALKVIFSTISRHISIPIVVIQHLEPQSVSYLSHIVQDISGKSCYEVEDKMPIEDYRIYTPAPNYHMMMEKDWTFSLNVEERVCYARPSIDVFFESAADAVGGGLIGIVLTGANSDGAFGLKKIKDLGGYTIVQEARDAYATEMPAKAIALEPSHRVVPLKWIGEAINELMGI